MWKEGHVEILGKRRQPRVNSLALALLGAANQCEAEARLGNSSPGRVRGNRGLEAKPMNLKLAGPCGKCGLCL